MAALNLLEIADDLTLVAPTAQALQFLLNILPPNSIHYTGLQKKFPKINFRYSISFSPAEYESESNFFLSRPDLTKFYDKGLKINKIRCF